MKWKGTPEPTQSQFVCKSCNTVIKNLFGDQKQIKKCPVCNHEVR